jgi:hypothetical protein
MLYSLKRHPFAVAAYFDHCLVLTYALPAEVLRPLLPPRLELETIPAEPFRAARQDPRTPKVRGPGELGFLAIAMVQTKGLRPAGFPSWLGQDFFLSGYRIFTRFRGTKRTLRGLRILRSDTDRRAMKWAGNLLTHYNYHHALVRTDASSNAVEFHIRTSSSEADLGVVADLSNVPAPLPVGSCFASVREAARFAGPLPYTFDYEPETNSLIVIRARRENWHPRPVAVDVRENTFLSRPPFRDALATLAAAFYVHDVSYQWERGVRIPLERDSA